MRQLVAIAFTTVFMRQLVAIAFTTVFLVTSGQAQQPLMREDGTERPASSVPKAERSGQTSGEAVQPSGEEAGDIPQLSAERVLVSSDAIEGSPVRDSSGQDFGRVKQLMLHPRTGKVQYVVISLGGFFGVGGQEVAVPWESVRLTRDEDDLVVLADREVLEKAPPPTEEKGEPERLESESGQRPGS